MPSLTLTTTSLLLLLFLPFTRATCYWANSTRAPNDPYSIAPDDTPCFPNQAQSPCCGTGWSCLSDGVCYISIKNASYYYRGTCTDKTWSSQQCPGWCFAQNSNTSIPLAKCQKPNGEDWYCCPGDADCSCSTGKDAVKLGDKQPTTVTVIGSTSWPGISSATATSGAGNIANGTSTVLASGTGTGSAAASTASSSNSNSSSGSSSSSTALAAGLGAGIGVAVLLIAGLGWYLFERSRKRRAAKASTATYPSVSNNVPPAMYGADAKVNGHPGAGYYATSAVNEKDGTKAFGTQELDTAARVRAEMPADGRGVGSVNGYASGPGGGSRHELP